MSPINPKLNIYEDGYAYNTETGESFFVNETGRFIIQLLREGKSHDEIVNEICEEYDALPQDVEKSYFEFVELLKLYQILS